jgi:LytS/YehU family sensor histidine kinase
MENYMSLVIAIVVTLLVNSIYAAGEFFNYWRNSVREQEELKRTGITAEFEALKNQVNPHFLFNSLNTLTSLIEEDTARATEFVAQLAHVYRYVLLNRDKETVSLGEELEFTRSFIYLNQVRFGDNLQVHVDVPAHVWSKHVPTLSLQMLVENAVKHNVISKDKPLTVHIGMNGNRLCVRNNLQRKPAPVAGSQIGLTNIMSRYAFYTHDEVEVSEQAHEFRVCLPLLTLSPVK